MEKIFAKGFKRAAALTLVAGLTVAAMVVPGNAEQIKVDPALKGYTKTQGVSGNRYGRKPILLTFEEISYGY
jgi:hypothetical protein